MHGFKKISEKGAVMGQANRMFTVGGFYDFDIGDRNVLAPKTKACMKRSLNVRSTFAGACGFLKLTHALLPEPETVSNSRTPCCQSLRLSQFHARPCCNFRISEYLKIAISVFPYSARKRQLAHGNGN